MRTMDRFGVPPTLAAEIEYRMRRLAEEASGRRRAVGHHAVRQHVGHVLIALELRSMAESGPPGPKRSQRRAEGTTR